MLALDAAASQPSEPPHSDEDEQQQEGSPPASLLALPAALLHAVVANLTSATHLAAAAASCATLRDVVMGVSWDQVRRYEAHHWTPALRGSLRWAAERLPQLRHLDLAGAAACSDADLLPLARLHALTHLSLESLPRVTGSSSCGGPQQQLDVLAAILAANTGLLSLDLSGTRVPVGAGLAAALGHLIASAPIATWPAHGLAKLRLAGCHRAAGAGGAPPQAALAAVLLQCPALGELDVSGCRWLAAEDVQPEGEALTEAVSRLPLRRASFAGCERLGGVGWLLSCWEHLRCLDVSGTALDDLDVQAIVGGCTTLRSLNLSSNVRLRGGALTALTASAALMGSALTELRLSDLAWELAGLCRMWSASCASPARLDLAGCGGLGDAALLALAPDPALHGIRDGYCLEELRVAGSRRLSAAALQQLAGATAGGGKLFLGRLQRLDVSHVESLGSKGSPATPAGAADDGGSASPAAMALAALLQASGGALQSCCLDGCWLGGGTLPLLARCCTSLRTLSVVGCSGVGDADMAALAELPQLRDLAVGGASLAWHEHRSLTGTQGAAGWAARAASASGGMLRLVGLTRLRVARRPFLTDAQLGPLLAANRGTLRHLELAGCASLTDAVLLHLLPPRPGGSSEPGASDSGQAGEQPAESGQAAGGAAGDAEQAQGQLQQLPARRDAPPLERLQLVCCDRLTGSSIRHLQRLQQLHLSGCPAITEAAVQAALISCKSLTLLLLPSHLPTSCLPVAPADTASHLHGVTVLGGREEGGRRGDRGRRRSGAS